MILEDWYCWGWIVLMSRAWFTYASQSLCILESQQWRSHQQSRVLIADFGLLYWGFARDQYFALLVSLFGVAHLLPVIAEAQASNCTRMKELFDANFCYFFWPEKHKDWWSPWALCALCNCFMPRIRPMFALIDLKLWSWLGLSRVLKIVKNQGFWAALAFGPRPWIANCYGCWARSQ